MNTGKQETLPVKTDTAFIQNGTQKLSKSDEVPNEQTKLPRFITSFRAVLPIVSQGSSLLRRKLRPWRSHNAAKEGSKETRHASPRRPPAQPSSNLGRPDHRPLARGPTGRRWGRLHDGSPRLGLLRMPRNHRSLGYPQVAFRLVLLKRALGEKPTPSPPLPRRRPPVRFRLLQSAASPSGLLFKLSDLQTAFSVSQAPPSPKWKRTHKPSAPASEDRGPAPCVPSAAARPARTARDEPGRGDSAAGRTPSPRLGPAPPRLTPRGGSGSPRPARPPRCFSDARGRAALTRGGPRRARGRSTPSSPPRRGQRPAPQSQPKVQRPARLPLPQRHGLRADSPQPWLPGERKKKKPQKPKTPRPTLPLTSDTGVRRWLGRDKIPQTRD